MVILLIELHFRGHVSEYVKHILNRLNDEDNKNEYLLYLHPSLVSIVPLSLLERKDVSLNFFSNSIIEMFEHCKSNKDISEFYWKQILNIKKTNLFHHILFLNINLILRSQLLFKPFVKRDFTFSGIFFQSPFILKKMGRSKLLSRLRREVMLRILILNRNCTDIFLLNDKEGTEFYSGWSSKIKFLPDPVNIVEPSNINIRKIHNLSDETFVFLHTGALGLYKGSIDILDSLKEINSEFFKNTKFLFIGKMDDTLINEINKINNFFNQRIIIFNNEFIKEEIFSAYIFQCDCLLIANKNVETSSGILNHALARRKTLISPNKGYYKIKLNDYSAALLFDETTSLSSLIIRVRNENLKIIGENKFDSTEYLNDNSPLEFTKVLLSKYI